MSKTLYIIRGLPGSGKSTLGEKLADTYMDYNPVSGGLKYYTFAADDWFTDQTTGEYEFNPVELPEAHDECQESVSKAMIIGTENICVCNTFSQSWEVEPYVKLCKTWGYTPVIIECQSKFNNVHGCPPEKIEVMRNRWEPIEL